MFYTSIREALENAPFISRCQTGRIIGEVTDDHWGFGSHWAITRKNASDKVVAWIKKKGCGNPWGYMENSEHIRVYAGFPGCWRLTRTPKPLVSFIHADGRAIWCFRSELRLLSPSSKGR